MKKKNEIEFLDIDEEGLTGRLGDTDLLTAVKDADPMEEYGDEDYPEDSYVDEDYPEEDYPEDGG